MLLKINHDGWHTYVGVAIRVPDTIKAGDMVPISARVARRINDVVCGVDGCECEEHIAIELDYGRYAVEIPSDWKPGEEIEISTPYGSGSRLYRDKPRREKTRT